MASRAESDISQKTDAGKLCMVAIVFLLGGLILFALGMMSLSTGCPEVQSVSGLVYPVFPLVMFFFSPFFGFCAIVRILNNWRVVTDSQDTCQEKDGLIKIARRFFLASLLYAVVCLLSIIFGIFNEKVQAVVSTGLLSAWSISIAVLAMLTGCIAYMLFTRSSSRLIHRIIAVLAIIAGLTVVGSSPWMMSLGRYLLNRFEYSELTETFSGSSDELVQTEIVPTLDSPSPGNRNVIWCSSFQLAWNRMKDDVIGEPVQVVGAEGLANRLNTAEQSAEDIQEKSFYAAAGRVEEGIISRIKEDMAAKFPMHPVPDFNDIPDIRPAILAYSYLTANVPFEYPYRQYEGPFTFTDSQGIETDVGAFGVWGLHSVYRKMREQVEILYAREDYNEPDYDRQMKEFAVDLCRHSDPYQVVVAIVEPKDTLAQTLDYIRGKIEEFKQQKNYERVRLLDNVDVLVVPEMLWEIEHHFNELIGKLVPNANPAMPIIEAKQSIRFKLDRYGAALESEATIGIAAIPRHFKFNRPFMVYMKKRDREKPFFVMWVDNAELLNRK